MKRSVHGLRRPSLSAALLATLDVAVSAAPLCLLALSTVPGSAKDKPIRFWNLTGETVTHLLMAPAGAEAFGPDQCRNDRDGTVGFDERLPITGVPPGRYDLRVDLKKGRRCRVRNVEVREGDVFSVEAADLVECAPSAK